MIVSVVAVALLFSGIRQYAGRTSKLDPVDYITFYAGCPIAAFDEFLKSPIKKPSLWGAKTLYYVYTSLNVFLIGRQDIIIILILYLVQLVSQLVMHIQH